MVCFIDLQTLLICKQILCILNWKNRLKTIHLSISVGVWLAKVASIAKDYPEFKGLVNWPALIYGLKSARSFICTLNDNNLSDFLCMIVKKSCKILMSFNMKHIKFIQDAKRFVRWLVYLPSNLLMVLLGVFCPVVSLEEVAKYCW